ncbi:hypothetical protein WJR50_13735 [Catalinimonas sp. 4WD22]|uniref:hypothetical protein n=1 Tax=Catalinimonas locisalis TaxID=3133978 RepID=UPI00310191AF
MKKSLQEELGAGRVTIKNAMENAEIMKTLGKLNYDAKEMNRGWGLLETVYTLQTEKIGKYGSQFGATQSFYEELEETKALYKTHRKLAKIACAGDREKFAKLQLVKNTNAVEKWLNNASIFYQELLSDSALIVQFGVTIEELQQMQAMIQALLDKRNRQISKKGEAQHATQKRNAALKAYQEWMKGFRLAARFAFRDDPQLLEILGIMVPTPR